MIRKPSLLRRVYVHAGIVVTVAVAALLLLIAAPRIGIGAEELKPMAEGAAVSPVLTYQGRLLNPTTGAPQPNGTYTFVFRIYNVESGGSALWTETKDLSVANGLFVTLLGDTTAFPANLFDGQNLWLGIKVGADAEATPRQRLAPVAYAMYSDNADRLDAQDSAFYRNATNINAGTLADARVAGTVARDSEVLGLVLAGDGAASTLDADLLDGQDSAFYRNATNINAGTLADARVAGTVARDSEVLGLVLAGDGAASTLDADLLDGKDSADFAAASHTHDNRYFTEGESDGRFVNASGDSMSGAATTPILAVSQTGTGTGVQGNTTSTTGHAAGVHGAAGEVGFTLSIQSGLLGESETGLGVAGLSTDRYGIYGHSINGVGVFAYSQNSDAIHAAGTIRADKVVYNSPRTHYYSISGDLFKPRAINSGTSLTSAGGSAGTYYTTGNTADDDLLAPVQLPDGATITGMVFYWYDISASVNLDASLLKHTTTGAYTYVNTGSSAGSAGNGSTIIPISETVDNSTTFYELYVRPPSGTKWETVGSQLRVIGVTISYTLNEAP